MTDSEEVKAPQPNPLRISDEAINPGQKRAEQ